MSIAGVSHIGIAVERWEEQLAHYRDVLGLELLHIEEVPDQQVRIAAFRAGAVVIELLHPTSPESPVAKFLAKRGEGIHHLAFAVEELASTLDELARRGVKLIDRAPRPGAGGKRIAFLHPSATFGVLTELCE